MNNSEFDKYIQSHTEKELVPPTDLNWDNMNIPFPNKKSKERKWYFLIIGFGLLLAIGFILQYQYFSQDENITSKIDEITSGDEKMGVSNPAINRDLPNHKNDKIEAGNPIDKGNDISKPESKTKSRVKIQQSNFSKNELENKSNNYEANINRNEILNKKDVFGQELHNQEKKLIGNSNSDLTNFQKVPNDNQNNHSSILKEDTEKSSKNLKVNNSSPNENRFFEILNLKYLPLLVTDPIKLESSLALNISNPLNFQTEISKNSKFDLQVAFGWTIHQNNYNSSLQSERLKMAEEIAVGHSANFSLNHKLSAKSFLRVGLTYQKLHNTFTNREYLGVFVNQATFAEVERTRYIFHNNYFENLSLNIGVGKSFSIIRNLELETVFQISPSLRLKEEGRVFNDELAIVFIEENAPSKSIYWNLGADLNMVYQLNRSKLFAGLIFSQSLSRLKIIEGSDLTRQPRILTLNLGIRRSF